MYKRQALVSANADLQDSTAKLKALDAAIREKKELQTQVIAYAKWGLGFAPVSDIWRFDCGSSHR